LFDQPNATTTAKRTIVRNLADGCSHRAGGGAPLCRLRAAERSLGRAVI
jgi:hypothetical protein